MKKHPIKGNSLTFAWGRYFRPHTEKGDYYYRLCLGKLSITFYTLDIDEFIHVMIQKGNKPNRAQRRKK